MRQRLFKIMVCVILMVSVFLSHSLVAVAADDLGKFDGTMSFVFVNPRVVCNFNSYIPDSASTGERLSAFASGDFVIGYFVMELDAGHAYSGTLKFNYSSSFSIANTSDVWCTGFSLNGVSTSGPSWNSFSSGGYAAGVTVASTSCSAYLVLNNYSVSTTCNVYFPIMMSLNMYSVGTSVLSPVLVSVTGSGSVGNIAVDLYDAVQVSDGSTIQYYINEQTMIMEKNDKVMMQQQQQIADQQAEQSRQQHDEQLHGFQDDAYNGAVSSAGGTVNDYVAAEGELMDSQHQQINDYADQNFNTGLIANYTTAIASVSTWYTQIWMSFGDFKTVFTVILSLGIAAALIGLKRFGGG